MTKPNVQAKIEPTIGRVLWFYPRGAQPPQQPHAAVVAYVHDDGRVNLGALTPDGVSYSATSVLLIQPGVEEPPNGNYACWMPYQQGQAKGPTSEAIAKRLEVVEEAVSRPERNPASPKFEGAKYEASRPGDGPIGPGGNSGASGSGVPIVPEGEAEGSGTAGESAVAEHGPTSPGPVRPGGKRHGR